MSEHDSVQLVSIPAGGTRLEGELSLPAEPIGLCIFVHGSGSSRHSPRNRNVAQYLRRSARVGTLLIDLLSEAEEKEDMKTARLRFDIGLLAKRVLAATAWARRDPSTHGLRIAYFGASTGSAAALVAAAALPGEIAAVISRGGRPDLAGPDVLARVRAPTLLIVGGEDHAVLEMNREAKKLLRNESALSVVPDARHLFEERGALEDVARRAAAWLVRALAPPAAYAAPRRHA